MFFNVNKKKLTRWIIEYFSFNTQLPHNFSVDNRNNCFPKVSKVSVGLAVSRETAKKLIFRDKK